VVVDSGVNAIPDLAGRVEAGISVANPPSISTDTTDTEGHGTLAASAIAAELNNGDGIAGIAPNVRIVPIKFCEPCGTFALVNAMDWIRDEHDLGRHMHVINMSFDAPYNGTVSNRLGQLRDRGMILIASAGNYGSGTVEWPASSSYVIGVAGTYPNGTRNISSSYGSALDLARRTKRTH
jgi:subtilisin family serine protease